VETEVIAVKNNLTEMASIGEEAFPCINEDVMEEFLEDDLRIGRRDANEFLGVLIGKLSVSMPNVFRNVFGVAVRRCTHISF
jgi:hypothetical protein